MKRVRVPIICAGFYICINCSDGESAELGDSGLDEDRSCIPHEVDPDLQGDCSIEDTDFTPCRHDGWDECISDDGEYHRIEEPISSVARVEAFERIADLLFDTTREPDGEDFLAARVIYQEDEGLDSRVVRRYDPHVEVPKGTDCSQQGTPDIYPDYCVGPARIQPILLEAFNAGIEGIEPRIQAARIEASLLWFLYVSTYKESLTCSSKAKDCDSAYAYYTGGKPARGGIGLARYLQERDPLAHDRAWDGLLAVRCWRDLDSSEVATDLEMRDRARDQYDRAVLDGVAAIVRHRFEILNSENEDHRATHWAFLKVLGPVLLREVERRAKADWGALQAEFLKTDPNEVDADRAIASIDAIFICP